MMSDDASRRTALGPATKPIKRRKLSALRLLVSVAAGLLRRDTCLSLSEPFVIERSESATRRGVRDASPILSS